MKPALSRLRGFTLIELVIVIILLGIMAAALVPLAVSGLRAYSDVLGNVIVLDKLRYATERLAREIREVNYASSSFVVATPVSACNNSMQFTRTSYDSAGVAVTGGDTTVTICTLNNAVTLSYDPLANSGCPTGTGTILTDEVETLQFCYRQSNGTSATSASNVRYVDISLSLRHAGVTLPFTQTTRVELKRYEKP